MAVGDSTETKGTWAGSQVQRVLRVSDNHQLAPKGCARDEISTGLYGTPERYQLMVPGISTGAGNARYLSGFWYLRT